MDVHYDNAPAHRSAATMGWIESAGVFKLVNHTPYSPDLAPCDFWLFPALMGVLAGRVFSSDDKVEAAIRKWCSDVPVAHWHQCFDKWEARLVKCIDRNGDYVEK